jgi:hypothetical protein
MEFETRQRIGRGRSARERGYDIIDGELKWGYAGKDKFEFVVGNQYKVSHESKALMRHKGAVGVYKGFQLGNDMCLAILQCGRKKFKVDAAALVPYDGEISHEHLKLISPAKKVHLVENGRCVCKCDLGGAVNPAKMLGIEEFLAIPENSRCTNCNNMMKKQSRCK